MTFLMLVYTISTNWSKLMVIYFLYDEIAINFRMNPNNHSFIKYIKSISALPINWLNETCISSTMPNFNEFKEKMLTQIELLNTSNKTAYAFLREKFKIYLLNNK